MMILNPVYTSGTITRAQSTFNGKVSKWERSMVKEEKDLNSAEQKIMGFKGFIGLGS